MLKKVTVLVVTCCIGLCFTSQKAQAQEGGAEERGEEEVIISPDSSSVETLLEEDKIQPVNESLEAPSNEIPSTSIRPNILLGTSPKPVITPVSTEKSKVKDAKSDVSFNLLYYLFYKFKHVDVSDN